MISNNDMINDNDKFWYDFTEQKRNNNFRIKILF